ncbi:MAG: GtrA family protein, partial [Corynebacterium matruchotii]
MTATPPGTPTTSASMPSESPEQPTQPASSASPQPAQQSQSDGSLRTQLVRFIAVGVVCAVIDYGTTLLLDYVLG